MSEKFHADMTISEVMQVDPRSIPIMLQYGMHCLGCPMATAESIKDACAVHGSDVVELVTRLNAIPAE